MYQVSLFHQCYMGLGFVFTHCESSITIVYDKIGICRNRVECVDFKGLDHQKKWRVIYMSMICFHVRYR